MKETIMNGHAVRKHIAHSYRSRHGRSSIIIVCPWCGQEVEAFIWSLAGSGKRCDCKDVIHYMSVSAKRKEDSK